LGLPTITWNGAITDQVHHYQHVGENKMANYCVVPPILACGTDKTLSFIRDEIINNAGHDQSNRYLGLNREHSGAQL
jgi:hypothetical protein